MFSWVWKKLSLVNYWKGLYLNQYFMTKMGIKHFLFNFRIKCYKKNYLLWHFVATWVLMQKVTNFLHFHCLIYSRKYIFGLNSICISYSFCISHHYSIDQYDFFCDKIMFLNCRCHDDNIKECYKNYLEAELLLIKYVHSYHI